VKHSSYTTISISGMDDRTICVLTRTDEFLNWMRSKKLQLNADKTDLVSCVTLRRLLLPVTPIKIGSEIISPSSSVRDLGV